MTEIRWQAYGAIPRAERIEGGPKDRPVGEPFVAASIGLAAAIGLRRVGRRDYMRVKSLAAMRLDREIP